MVISVPGGVGAVPTRCQHYRWVYIIEGDIDHHRTIRRSPPRACYCVYMFAVLTVATGCWHEVLCFFFTLLGGQYLATAFVAFEFILLC